MEMSRPAAASNSKMAFHPSSAAAGGARKRNVVSVGRSDLRLNTADSCWKSVVKTWSQKSTPTEKQK